MFKIGDRVHYITSYGSLSRTIYIIEAIQDNRIRADGLMNWTSISHFRLAEKSGLAKFVELQENLK